MRIRALGFAVLTSLSGGMVLEAAELAGTVTLVRRGKPSRLGDLRDAVVWWEPAAGDTGPVPQPSEHVMSTKDKEFSPHVLVVTAGESVRFPNQDPILHNVFSVSGRNSFDLGFYKTGPGQKVVFTEPGLVRVFCNVHHSMVGYVMVLATPYRARPVENGGFRLQDLPAGEGTLHVWHERADPVALPLRIPATAPVAVQLEVTRPRVPQHTNKHGRAYDSTSSYE